MNEAVQGRVNYPRSNLAQWITLLIIRVSKYYVLSLSHSCYDFFFISLSFVFLFIFTQVFYLFCILFYFFISYFIALCFYFLLYFLHLFICLFFFIYLGTFICLFFLSILVRYFSHVLVTLIPEEVLFADFFPCIFLSLSLPLYSFLTLTSFINNSFSSYFLFHLFSLCVNSSVDYIFQVFFLLFSLFLCNRLRNFYLLPL